MNVTKEDDPLMPNNLKGHKKGKKKFNVNKLLLALIPAVSVVVMYIGLKNAGYIPEMTAVRAWFLLKWGTILNMTAYVLMYGIRHFSTRSEIRQHYEAWKYFRVESNAQRLADIDGRELTESDIKKLEIPDTIDVPYTEDGMPMSSGPGYVLPLFPFYFIAWLNIGYGLFFLAELSLESLTLEPATKLVLAHVIFWPLFVPLFGYDTINQLKDALRVKFKWVQFINIFGVTIPFVSFGAGIHLIPFKGLGLFSAGPAFNKKNLIFEGIEAEGGTVDKRQETAQNIQRNLKERGAQRQDISGVLESATKYVTELFGRTEMIAKFRANVYVFAPAQLLYIDTPLDEETATTKEIVQYLLKSDGNTAFSDTLLSNSVFDVYLRRSMIEDEFVRRLRLKLLSSGIYLMSADFQILEPKSEERKIRLANVTDELIEEGKEEIQFNSFRRNRQQLADDEVTRSSESLDAITLMLMGEGANIVHSTGEEKAKPTVLVEPTPKK